MFFIRLVVITAEPKLPSSHLNRPHGRSSGFRVLFAFSLESIPVTRDLASPFRQFLFIFISLFPMWFLGQLIYDGFYDGFSFVQLFCHLASSKLLESFETSMARRGREGKKKHRNVSHVRLRLFFQGSELKMQK